MLDWFKWIRLRSNCSLFEAFERAQADSYANECVDNLKVSCIYSRFLFSLNVQPKFVAQI